ncbi:MAG: DUF433 domain-containing protein [Candidatus Eisenbacteria bacterium]
MSSLPQVVEAQYRDGFRIHLVFNDGVEGTVDFRDWLSDPVFEPLKDRGYFQRFFLDGGTVAWPNGADIAPETLYESTKARNSVRPRLPQSAPGSTLLRDFYSATLTAMESPIKRITVDPMVCQGQPCVRGLRIPVSVVLRHLADGKTVAEIVDEFPELESDDVSECLRYAAWLASGRAIDLPPAA